MKPPTRPVSKTTEALKESTNVVCMAGAFALSAALLNPLPLLAAFVCEAAYLLFVPDSKWYDARLAVKYDNDVVKRREALKARVFKSMSGDLQLRFGRLENLRTGIAKESYEGKRWYREVVRKLDYLMEKFLLFGTKQGEFVAYLSSLRQELGVEPRNFIRSTRATGIEQQEVATDDWVNGAVSAIQQAYKQEIAGVDKSLENEQNLHNQAVLNKRHEVLDRRQQYVSQIGEILLNIGHQIRLIEDTFGLINDEIRARSPDQVLADIDDVVFQTDNLSETLQEVAPFDTLTTEA